MTHRRLPARLQGMRRVLAVALCVVLAAALASCGQPTRANEVAKAILELYERVPEITNLQVTSELVEGTDKREFVVSGVISPGLPVQDITALLAKHPGRVEDAGIADLLGGEEPLKLRLEKPEFGAGSLTMTYIGDVDVAQLEPEVIRWEAVQTVLAARVDLLLDTEGLASYAVNLGSGREGAVAAAYAALLGEPSVTGLEQLSKPSQWEVITEVNGVLLRAASERGLPTSGDVAQIRSLNAAIFPDNAPTNPQPTTPNPFPSGTDSSQGPVDSLPGSFRVSRVDIDLGDRLALQTQFTATTEGEVSLATVTPLRYGSALWPVLRGQLDTLKVTPSDWSYRVAVEPVGNSVEESRVTILSQLKGRDPKNFGEPPTAWDVDAYAYVTAVKRRPATQGRQPAQADRG